jgi:integrase
MTAARLRRLAAAQSFAAYLVEVGVLTTNPIRDVQAPPPAKPREVEIALADVLRIVENAPAPYPALFGLLYDAGVEVSAALGCVESDVDVERRELRARGTKAHTRDRIVRVAEWEWPFLEKHHATLTPGERVFRGRDRWQVGGAHRARLVALGLPHHRVHDSRHFYRDAGNQSRHSYELVARQLGHADIAMVAKVYGRFAPRSDERDRWERIAAEQDTKSSEMGTVVGTAKMPNENTKPGNPKEVTRLPNSRGGTRTRDPGIMSAVL